MALGIKTPDWPVEGTTPSAGQTRHELRLEGPVECGSLHRLRIAVG